MITAFDLLDEAATSALAGRIAALAEPGDVIALKGELGAGKTAFARAFICARGGEEEVPSPTFTLVQTYALDPAAIWHFDLYRLRAPEEAWELGIEDAFADGISLIEWPERLGSLLPERRLEIAFDFGGEADARCATLRAGPEWRARLAAVARGSARQAFLDGCGWAGIAPVRLAADASFRSYYRLRGGGRGAILMDAPPPQEDVGPYVRVANILRELDLSAPQVLAEDRKAGFLLIEDFGDDTYSRLLESGADEPALYALAIDTLVALQQKVALRDPPALPPYDERAAAGRGGAAGRLVCAGGTRRAGYRSLS